MDSRALFGVLDALITENKVGVLANIGKDGYPRLRWMTPALIRGRTGFLYAVTPRTFTKSVELEDNPAVEWLFQTSKFDQILRVKGKMQVIDNPALKADVLEALGGHLERFWVLKPEDDEIVVLETIIESLKYEKPGENVYVVHTVESAE